MIFNIDWVITNPVQTIDSGVKVLFDSEPILAAVTIVTFIIVVFFVWNKNKVKLHRMVHDRQPMESVKIDKDDLLELKSALGKATTSEESMRSPLRQFSEEPSAGGPLPPKEQTKTSGEAEIDGVSDVYEEKPKETPRERMKRLWKEGKMGRKKHGIEPKRLGPNGKEVRKNE